MVLVDRYQIGVLACHRQDLSAFFGFPPQFAAPQNCSGGDGSGGSGSGSGDGSAGSGSEDGSGDSGSSAGGRLSWSCSWTWRRVIFLAFFCPFLPQHAVPAGSIGSCACCHKERDEGEDLGSVSHDCCTVVCCLCYRCGDCAKSGETPNKTKQIMR
jgi:hypothetical protein